jgi:NAD(P)-dependent dehydrogenase (short-subunit alcohol dehydrogenase family)
MADRKAVFITGAASGIGLASAKRFAAEGWFVGLADIDAAGLDRALKEVGPDKGVAVLLDVRDRSDWTRAMEAFAKASGGRLDVMINNAGVARYGWFEDVSPDETDQIVAVNIGGVFNGVYASLALLKATPGSRLINVASVAGFVAAPKLAVYVATKHAVRGLSDALGLEFARHGIGVSCIMPWFIETPLLDQPTAATNQSIRETLKGQPVYGVDEVAAEIWVAATRGGAHHLVGGQAKIASLLQRWAPGLLRSQMKAMARG